VGGEKELIMKPKQKRVCIVGGGASGVAAAWSLSQEDSFHVEIWEKTSRLGGVATSLELDSGIYINDQVQGGTPSYRNTILLLKELGWDISTTHMRISFGTGERQWSNIDSEASPLIKKLEKEIRRFGRVLSWVKWLELLFVFIPIDLVLKVLGFSADFRNYLLYPLCALFFGTGIQTPRVSTAVIARVFLDEDGKLFDYDPQRFLSQQPQVFAFPKLSAVYDSAAKKLVERGVKICYSRVAKSVIRTNTSNNNNNKEEEKKQGVWVIDDRGERAFFDDVILCCDAEVALSLLVEPRWLERFALRNVEYYYDTVITHEDVDYITHHYDTKADRQQQYFVRVLPQDAQKVEMSFHLNHYQPQLKTVGRPLFQTIFPAGNIRSDKILYTRVTKHNAHTWKHFCFTVLFWRWLQGYRHTWFAGGYCLFNIHETAVVSGLAAAYRIGGKYPFEQDSQAKSSFFTFLRLVHGVGS
jgi:predicted NAD/FAD-binding protein